MTFGILCTGPDVYRYPPPAGLAVSFEGKEWCWYHNLNEKILYPDYETAIREATNASRYNPEWRYEVLATE